MHSSHVMLLIMGMAVLVVPGLDHIPWLGLLPIAIRKYVWKYSAVTRL